MHSSISISNPSVASVDVFTEQKKPFISISGYSENTSFSMMFDSPEQAEEYALKINEAARKMRNKLDDLDREVESE